MGARRALPEVAGGLHLLEMAVSARIDIKMRGKQIDDCIELLCRKGCRSVREDIRLLERGTVLPELRGLDDLARQAVLNELRSIMAVYGDSCPIPISSDTSKDG